MAAEKWYVVRMYLGEQKDYTDYGDPVMRDVYGYRVLAEADLEEYEDDIVGSKGQPFYDKEEADQHRYEMNAAQYSYM